MPSQNTNDLAACGRHQESIVQASRDAQACSSRLCEKDTAGKSGHWQNSRRDLMDYFTKLDAFPVLADLIAAIPGTIAPALMVLAACLCLFAFVDGVVDAADDHRAQ
jgi:hypothetical protein